MKFRKKILVITIASIVAGNAQAAFMVDGINTGGNEYQAINTQQWGFYDGHGNGQGNKVGGFYSYGMDDTNIFVLIGAPTDFVDNIFGVTSSLAASGWVSQDGAEPGHKFKQLLGSDKMWFQVDQDGDGNADSDAQIVLDYIAELDGGGYAATTESKKKVAKKKTAKKKAAKKKAAKKKAGGVTSADAGLNSLVQEVATSLQYNLSFGDTCTTRDTNDVPVDSISGGLCVDQLMYEFSFLQSDFTNFTSSSLSGFGIHASPKKLGGNDTFVPCDQDPYRDCPSDIPEPSILSLFLGGIAGLTLVRRRRSKKEI
jgi:hypothetical protein